MRKRVGCAKLQRDICFKKEGRGRENREETEKKRGGWGGGGKMGRQNGLGGKQIEIERET